LAIGIDPQPTLNRLNKYFKPPDDYLGTKIRETSLKTGGTACGQSSSHYVNNAVNSVEAWLQQRDMKFPARSQTPMMSNYRPELDVSPELDAEDGNFYQSLIGVLRWAVEIGRIDITTEVSMLASQMAMPREGHMLAVLRVFAYLKAKHNSRLVFDPTYPKIKHDSFKDNIDWTIAYGEIKEAISPDAPQPRGKAVVLQMYVDSDHAGDQLTRRSRSGFVQYVNSAPILWYSKKQGSIETSTFGSEFVALSTAVAVNRALR
jgi:hypothetical protein